MNSYKKPLVLLFTALFWAFAPTLRLKIRACSRIVCDLVTQQHNFPTTPSSTCLEQVKLIALPNSGLRDAQVVSNFRSIEICRFRLTWDSLIGELL